MAKNKTPQPEPDGDVAPPVRMNYAQAATYLGATERQVRRAAADGEIGYTKIGLFVRFTQEQLDEYLVANTFVPRRRSS